MVPIDTVSKNDTNKVTLQEVRNLGYNFYLGEIETSSTTNINDETKNQITKIAYDAHFPARKLKTIPIIILNNLALTGKQYVVIDGKNLKIPDLKAEFLSEGGLYTVYENGSAIIFINKSTIVQGNLTDVLTHELGHAVAITLTSEDWATFYKLRGIPVGTERRGKEWKTSPQEDFAEVYKSTFTGIRVRTSFGQLLSKYFSDTGHCHTVYNKMENYYSAQLQEQANTVNETGDAFQMPSLIDFNVLTEKVNSDKEVQECRRDVMFNPSKYPNEWNGGETPYFSSGTVDADTKNFISNIVNKLNGK